MISNLRYSIAMKLGLVLQSNKPEHVWNTLRLGVTALKASHQVAEFKKLKGEIYADRAFRQGFGFWLKYVSNLPPHPTTKNLRKNEATQKYLTLKYHKYIL